ncbi:MAG: hypothetical protein WD377_03330 [Nitriliruptoraceae bacterium]
MLLGAAALVGESWVEHRTLSRDVVKAHVVNLLWNGLHGLDPIAGSSDWPQED